MAAEADDEAVATLSVGMPPDRPQLAAIQVSQTDDSPQAAVICANNGVLISLA